MFELAEEWPTSPAAESLKIGMEMCTRMVMLTLTVSSFLRNDQSSHIYNNHVCFLLLVVMEIYTASFPCQDT